MAKRSADVAEINDGDELTPKRPKHNLVKKQSPQSSFSRDKFYDALCKYFHKRNRFLWIASKDFRTFGDLTNYKELVISWTPEFHFARSPRERRLLFTLVLLYHYGKLPVDLDCFGLIVNRYLVSSHPWGHCKECNGLSSVMCTTCHGMSIMFVNHADIVKLM